MEFLLQWLENAWTQLVTFLQGCRFISSRA